MVRGARRGPLSGAALSVANFRLSAIAGYRTAHAGDVCLLPPQLVRKEIH
ncbi:hypothetical protein BLA3211_00515 [Burkholderia aenigmatica]|uniref:Uncharacterized protein n=1 Tax=Burkholderia aenigmatica TaxID=2015348 RepID=A0A6J5IMC8_9BURK|nr:hypothetical protein BLA3211_00515 [Burkholderia aenigmatica]